MQPNFLHNNIIMYICTSVGCLVTAGLVILSYFWLLYICHLALKIFYPMKSSKLINSDYSRTIYIAGFLLIIFIGVAPSVITAAYSNYKIVRFPPTQCGTTGAYRFYEIIVPVMISVALSQILLLLIIYKIHMVSLKHVKLVICWGNLLLIYLKASAIINKLNRY